MVHCKTVDTIGKISQTCFDFVNILAVLIFGFALTK